MLTALRRGFEAAGKAQQSDGATLQQKAVIFTESRRTQEYLFRILEETEFAGKVMRFNGTNTDPHSKGIYKKWLERYEGTDKVSGSPSADMRAALVEHFREGASILIATEAAAEGINLQFCNLVVNYDLPWNPQRIEQRIGRCHRYGQKFDVVVVNFLNKSNAADLRVYELLAEKFKLFDGVFGASDEVLGALESGVDFEKRIAGIYQKCRSPQQIAFEFDELQKELEEDITARQRDAREKLLDNFDQEVIEKVKMKSHDVLDKFNGQLWTLTRFLLADAANFDEAGHSFLLNRNPFPGETIHPGPYRMGKGVEDVNVLRVGHPLAQRVLRQAKTLELPSCEVAFQYSGSGKNIAVLDSLRGQSGWITCQRLSLTSLEAEDWIVLAGVTDDGLPLEGVQCRRLFDLAGSVGGEAPIPGAVLDTLRSLQDQQRAAQLEEASARNGSWFELEMDKLDRWAEDRRASLKAELDEVDQALKEAKKAARTAPTLPEKLERRGTLAP